MHLRAVRGRSLGLATHPRAALCCRRRRNVGQGPVRNERPVIATCRPGERLHPVEDLPDRQRGAARRARPTRARGRTSRRGGAAAAKWDPLLGLGLSSPPPPLSRRDELHPFHDAPDRPGGGVGHVVVVEFEAPLPHPAPLLPRHDVVENRNRVLDGRLRQVQQALGPPHKLGAERQHPPVAVDDGDGPRRQQDLREAVREAAVPNGGAGANTDWRSISRKGYGSVTLAACCFLYSRRVKEMTPIEALWILASSVRALLRTAPTNENRNDRFVSASHD
jgi:hypothetical protein